MVMTSATKMMMMIDDDDDGDDDDEDHANGDYKPCSAAKPSLISTFVEPWPSRHLLQSCF